MNENFSQVNLKNILNGLKRGLWLLVLFPLLAVIICGYIHLYHLTPLYQASTILMVGKVHNLNPIPPGATDNNAIQNDTVPSDGTHPPVAPYDDSPVATQLVNTYSEIAKSRAVSKQVVSAGELQITPEELRKKITVSTIKDTQLISLSVTDADPKVAAELANQTATIFTEKVQQIMQFNNVTIVDPAVVPEKPVKPNILFNTLVSGLLGLFLAVLVVFMTQPFKQTIQNKQEVEELLSVPVLGIIPVIKKYKYKFNKNSRKRHAHANLKS